MRRNNITQRTPKAIEDIIVEKNIRRTWLQRIFHTLCLIIPICFCFAGYYLSPIIYSIVSNKANTVPEIFKFCMVLLFFAVSCTIIFFKTRNTNPIIKIRVLTRKK